MIDDTRKVLNDAVTALQAAKGRIKKLESKFNEPIAIVSMACRLPAGINTPEEYWKILQEGKDLIEEFPKDRWDAKELYDPNPEAKGKTYCKEGGFLRDIDKFDATFFGISPREANSMDPQQRLVLETSWEALERMGTLPLNLNTSKTGVYIGAIATFDEQTNLETLDGYAGTGKLNSVISGRIAYTLGLQGPAITVDTACSSSLVAIHLAAQALRLGECDLALAGGVTVMLSPAIYVEFSRLKGMAIDGRCKSFSAKADGTSWSEGCGILVLKRLSDAQKDKDKILAVIRGTAINQDGRSQGLTAPNGPSQQKVIQKALELSNLKPSDIDAIEAHGTGTTLGDPIEATSLAEVFASTRPEGKPLYLGSSKSNLGHSQAAAGVTGLMKMVLALQNQSLPKTLHAETPSPNVKWEGSGLELLTSAKNWQPTDRPRRCGISSFGISGTNAHIILEEASTNDAADNNTSAENKPNNSISNLLLLSGQTPEALEAQAAQFAKYIEDYPQHNLSDICHTAALHRTHFSHRLALQSDKREQLIEQLKAYADKDSLSEVESGVASSKPIKIAFLFTGQGSQYAGMAKELYQKHSLFKTTIDKCANIIDPLIQRSILELIFANIESKEAELLNQTRYTQPALFAVEYALYQIWSNCGIKKPLALLGHSIGELVAATIAGVFSLEDGLKLAVARGQLMFAMQPGSMISVDINEQQAETLINKFEGKLSIAGLNAPLQTVISGETSAIKELIEQLKEHSIKHKELVVSHAFHSQMMDKAAAGFEQIVSRITRNNPSIAVVSNVTGKIEKELLTEPTYWSKQLRQAVRFTDGLKTLTELGITTFIELGPQPILSGLGTQINSNSTPNLNFYGSLKKNQSDTITLSKTVASLWLEGIELDWKELLPGKFVPIPTYPFQREKYWLETTSRSSINRSTGQMNGQRVDLPDGQILHIIELSPKIQTELADHIIHGQMVLAGAYYLSILLTIAQHYWPDQPIEIKGFRILRAFIFDNIDELVKLHISLQAEENGFAVSVYSFRKEEWVKYIETHISACEDLSDNLIDNLDIDDNLNESSLSLRELDEVLKAVSVEWGEEWWAIDQAVETSSGILSRYRLPKHTRSTPFCPVALDNAFGSMFWLLANSGKELIEKGTPILPIAIDKLVWYGNKGHIRWAEHRLSQEFNSQSETTKSQLSLWDESGKPLLSILGFRTRRAAAQQFLSKTNAALHTINWQILNLTVDNNLSQPQVALIGKELNSKSNVGELLNQNVESVLCYRDLNMLCDALDNGVTTPELIIVEFINETYINEQLAHNAIIKTQELLTFVQSWLKDKRLISTTLVIITKHAVLVGEAQQELSLTYTPIIGLIASIQNEYPNRNIKLIDIDENDNWPLINIAVNSEYKQLALRKHQLFYPSLKAIKPNIQEKLELKLNGTVLITGGLGSLGKEVARYLAKELLVKHLLLVSRQGSTTAEANELIRELAEYGANATVATCDVANYEELQNLIDSIPTDKALCGIIHCAGIIDDGLVLQQTVDRLEKVMLPKVMGAWNLHLLTKDKQLTMFILFSSLAATLGNPGQSNYAAANRFLDGLAQYRQQQGLAAQSLAWTAWAEVGMVARLSENARHQLAGQDINALSTAEALKLFRDSLTRPEPILIPAQLNIEKTKRGISSTQKDTKTKDFSALKLQLQELTPTQREQALLDIITQELASVLGMTAKEKIDINRPFTEMGLDSLMAVELRDRISKKTSLNLPATLAFDYPSLKQVASFLSEKLGYDKAVITAKTKPTFKTKQQAIEPIAIVSVACQFPGGVKDLESFWQLLIEGRDAITTVPTERWDVEKYFDTNPEIKGKTYAKWGGFLGDIRQFDAGFFGISPREAVSLDPQQRLLLETSWEVLENAGIVPEQIMGSNIGVYIGMCGHEYLTKVFADPEQIDAYSLLGTQHSATVGRLSYILGLKGPNLPIDTACSSSLVAVHLAVQALRQNECDGALVGGVNLIIDPKSHIYFSKLKALSPRGKCHTFSADADGYVRGEGCAMLYLKRLSDAQRDNDSILAVIRGTAVNQDGRSNGMTAPNGPSQQAVIKAALNQANIDASSVSYVECHGTGTPLGDPIEVQSLAAVYGAERSQSEPVYIGSVKTNFGHTEGAAGIAGVIKAALCLQKQKLVKSLHFTAPNPHIPWSEIPVKVLTSEMDWLSNGTPRRVGVSSFGFSGTNAHAILEEAPELAVKQDNLQKSARNILLLSGQTEQALRSQARKYAEHIEQHTKQDLADICYSAVVHRTHFDHRLALEVQDREQVIEQLKEFALNGYANEINSTIAKTKTPKIAFLFTGQGAQYVGMAKQLYQQEPLFRETLNRCAAIIDPLIEKSILEIIFTEIIDSNGALIDQTQYTQPALFAIEYSLYKLWSELGVQAEVLLGHSIGELVAATCSGVFSLEDGLKLAVERGRLMWRLPKGAMISIEADEAKALTLIDPLKNDISIAGINAPNQTVISGNSTAIKAFTDILKKANVKYKELTVSHAFHSQMMDAMLEQFEDFVTKLELNKAVISIASNLTGKIERDCFTDPKYWSSQIRQPVRFLPAIKNLLDSGINTFIELGPQPVLSGLITQSAGSSYNNLQITTIPSLKRQTTDNKTFADAIFSLWVNRVALDWRRLFVGKLVALPNYQFQRQHYWLKSNPTIPVKASSGRYSLSGERIKLPDGKLFYRVEISPAIQKYLADHLVYNTIVVPGAFYLSVLLAVAEACWPNSAIELKDIHFVRALIFPNEESRTSLFVQLEPVEQGYKVTLSSEDKDENWTTHAIGEIYPLTKNTTPLPDYLTKDQIDKITELGFDVESPLNKNNIEWGKQWCWTKKAQRVSEEIARCLFITPEGVVNNDSPIAGAFIDNGLILEFFLSTQDEFNNDYTTRVPFAIKSLRWYGEHTIPLMAQYKLNSKTEHSSNGDIVYYDNNGCPLASITGFTTQSVSIEKFLPGLKNNNLYKLGWVKLLPNNETIVKNSLILGSKELADQLGSYYFENIAELFQYIDGNGSPEQIIIDATTQNSPDLISQLRDNTYNNLNNIQAILSKNELNNTELIWVTQGAIATDIKDQGDRQIANLTLSWSPLVGLLRTARSEHPKRSIRLIDKDNSTTTGLLKIAINNNSEPEILLRSGVMFGARLQVVEQKAVDSIIESPALTLNIIKQGDLDGIALKPNSNALAKLSSKQVRIAVQASGINFRDVLNVLGMYPGDAGAFGGEGAGVVLEVGSEVTTFAPGDCVMGFIPWAFSTMAISESNKLLPLPKAWSYEDGATVMGAFLTAWYGLVEIAKLKRGEKILIHAATGGVGSAAIQVAKYIGAEIFATAHPSKWDILKGWGLDDNHISNSRTLDFEKDFLTFTDSKGVDVVLHSLAREFTDASLRLMPNGGRFIEIGKIDLRDSEQVASTYKGVQYLPFDLYNEPETVMSAMLAELNTLFNQGVFKPLAYSNWNLKDAPLAFRHMAQAKHIGKVVLSSPRVIDPAGVVLITGGTGSLGSLVATHLVQQYGVRRLALLSRQGLATPEALKIKKQLEENLALVDIYTCDIANKDELKNVIEQISQKAPLTGVVHCAGTLADGLLLSQNIENFNKVLLSKVDGAWNLHQLTKDKALDLFVMFSSMSGIIGNPGQSNYAAANTFLDALAIYRRTQGLPAQSLAWGLWQQSESGMTAHLSQTELIRMKRQGLEVITEKEGLALFDKAISLIEPLLIPANLNLETLSKQPVIPSLLSEIIKSKALKQRTEISHQKSDLSLKESLKALPENEQFARLLSIVTKEITHILAIPESNPIPPEKLFQELGLDSLMAVETRNRLSTIFAIDLPISSILLFPTAQSLTLELLRLLQLDSVKDNATGTNTSETNITIKKVSRNQTLPLSFSQQRIWFASQLEPNSPYYNLPFALKINGKLQVAALEQSINEIVNRHEILRTTYTMVDGIVSQIVNPIQRLFIEKIDLQNLDQNSREAETQNLIAQSAGEVFDLTTLPLIKVKLLQLQAEQHLLLLTIHHIAIDGWSADLLFRELGQLYQAFSQNKPSPLPELEIQYADYSYWQRNWFTDERLNKDLDYWKQQLEGIKALQLPTDRPKPIVPTGQAATIYFNLSSELASNLKKLAQKENVTLYNIMLAALNVLLYRYTGQEDICIGSATANRNQLEIETLIGCFINILIIRNNLSGNPSFSELLQRVREVSFAAFAHQDLPVEKIFEQLKFDRNKNVLPHQQMGFSFQRVLTSADWQLANLNLELSLSDTATTVTQLFMRITETEEKLYGMLEYSTDLFNESTINTIIENYLTILNTIAESPEQRIRAIQLFHKDIINLTGINTSIEQISPLTPTQRDLYLANLINPNSTIFSDGTVVKIGKNVNVAIWQQAIEMVAECEEMTKTQFALLRDEPIQFITKAEQPKFEFIDLSYKPDVINVKEFITNLVKLPYDLKSGFLYKFYLIKDQQGEYIAVLAWFHILFDAYSVTLLLEKIGKVYQSLLNGQTPECVSNGSFYSYTQDIIAQVDSKETKEFWSEQFKNIEPLSAAQKTGKAPQARRIPLNIAGEKLANISKYCKSVNCSFSVYFRALFGLVLDKWFNPTNNFLMYEVVGLRPTEHINTIGCIYQVVPTIFSKDLLGANTEIRQYLTHVKEYKKKIGAKQNISVFMQKQLIKEEGLKFYFNWCNFSIANLLSNDCKIEYPKTCVEDEIHLIIYDLKESLELVLFYDESFFYQKNLLERIIHLSDQIISGTRNIDELSIVLPEERNWLVQQLNSTQVNYPNTTIIKLFEQQAAKAPDAIALVFEDRQLTYSELNSKANQLANYLIQLNVGTEVLVGICVERSLEMIIGILGILKAGGAYIPIDPTYPQDRQAFILDDAKLNILLTQEKLVDKLPSTTAKLICLDRDWLEISRQSSNNLSNILQPENLAYIIYTSGSTGNPKGVMVTHFNVVRLMLATEQWFNFNERDTWTLFHSYAFDFSVWEIWGALVFGGKLVIVPYLTSRNPESFYKLLIQEQVTVLNQTPAAFRQLIKVDEQAGEEREKLSLRYVIFGGEALELNSLKPWFDRHSDQQPQLINMYGITETTVHVTYRPLTKDDTTLGSVIGKAIPDLQIFILDKYKQQVPVGVIGEIYVGGAGVARGYFNRKELTEERFINHKLSDLDTTIRLYRTGDIAKYLEDGDIEYLGRNDNQVKIRGFRIELGEIESALIQHPDVLECVVIAKEDQSSGKKLVAYMVMGQTAKATSAEIKETLKQKLPEYMLPSLFIRIDKFPLTANGKIDHKALIHLGLEQNSDSLSKSYVAPRNSIEETLAEIYSNLLGIDKVGINDNFFDIGGHSLLATRLMANIEKRLGVRLPLSTLIQAATIERLGEILRKDQYIPEWSSLVEIQTNGTEKPIFVVHPAGGNVLSYTELALKLGQNQPFYGFQSNGLNEEQQPHQTIEEMAAHYIKLMKEVQPKGSYKLAGHSMGGVVAFEMAQQLLAKGEEVGLLVLFDSWIPTMEEQNSFKDNAIDDFSLIPDLVLAASKLNSNNRKINELIEKINQLDTASQLEYIATNINNLPNDIDKTQKELFLKVFKINSQAMCKYQPKIYPGKIVFFRASEGILSEMFDFSSVWSKISSQPIECYSVPGDHQTMLISPNVEVLVKYLNPILQYKIE